MEEIRRKQNKSRAQDSRNFSKKSISFFSFLIIIIIIIFSLFSPTILFHTFYAYSESEKIIVKVGTLASESTSWIAFWNKVASSIERKSGGRVKFITYTGGVMGDEDEMLAKMRIGQLHAGGFTVNGLRKIAPELGAIDVPFLFQNYDEVDLIINKFFSEFESYFTRRGYELLLLIEQGFIYFFSVKDISGFRDIGNTKMWVWLNEMMVEKVARVLGAGMVILPVPELFSALDKGIVETFQTSPMACLSLQWCKLAKVMIDYPYRYEPAAIVITKSFFEKLLEDIRNTMKQEAKNFMWDFIREIRAGQSEHKERLKMLGIKFIKPSDEDIRWFEKLSKDNIWYAKDSIYPHDLLKRINAELENFRNRKFN